MTLPGWDSVESAGWWGTFYFWASIGSLVLLGATEVLSHRYTDRRDTLAAQQQRTAETNHAAEMAATQQKLEEARHEVAAVQVQQRPRRIRDADKPSLIKELAAYAGQIVLLQSPIGDAEAAQLAQDIRQILEAANWKVEESSGIYFPAPTGIVISISHADFVAQKSDAANTVMRMFQQAGYADQARGQNVNDLPPGKIQILIGSKPAPKQ
jgi:hypothetical protein